MIEEECFLVGMGGGERAKEGNAIERSGDAAASAATRTSAGQKGESKNRGEERSLLVVVVAVVPNRG